MNLTSRTRLAEAILDQREAVGQAAGALADERSEKYAAQLRCLVRYLAAAAQAGEPSIFADYLRWNMGFFVARQVDLEELRVRVNYLEEILEVSQEFEVALRGIFEAGHRGLERGPFPAINGGEPGEATPLQAAYLAAAMSGDRPRAWTVVEGGLADGVGVGEFYHEVIIWTQARVGALWVRNEISEAKEHLVSAVTQSVLAGLYSKITGPRNRGRILMIAVEGEAHLLPVNIVADLLELKGWDVRMLGSFIPLPALLDTIEEEAPDVVALGATLSAYVPEATRMIIAIQERFSELPIVAGGQGVTGARAHFEELGVMVSEGRKFEAFDRLAKPQVVQPGPGRSVDRRG